MSDENLPNKSTSQELPRIAVPIVSNTQTYKNIVVVNGNIFAVDADLYGIFPQTAKWYKDDCIYNIVEAYINIIGRIPCVIICDKVIFNTFKIPRFYYSFIPTVEWHSNVIDAPIFVTKEFKTILSFYEGMKNNEIIQSVIKSGGFPYHFAEFIIEEISS